jgi:hypothetical protein
MYCQLLYFNYYFTSLAWEISFVNFHIWYFTCFRLHQTITLQKSHNESNTTTN